MQSGASSVTRETRMNRLLAALVLIVLTSTAVRAEQLTWRFDFFDQAHFSYMWGWMGDDFGPFTGEITSAKVVFDGYITEGDIDTSDFYFTFDVPTLGKQAWINLTGENMGWTGSGPVSHTFTSTDFNGELREGRFGAEMTACMPGAPSCNGSGSFVGEAYIEFTIEGLRADPVFNSNFDDIWE